VGLRLQRMSFLRSSMAWLLSAFPLPLLLSELSPRGSAPGHSKSLKRIEVLIVKDSPRLGHFLFEQRRYLFTSAVAYLSAFLK